MVLNASSIVQHEIRIKNAIIKHVNVNVKIIINRKKIKHMYLWEYENSKNLKSIDDKSLSEFGEIIIIADIVLTKGESYSNKKDKYYSSKKTNITNSASISYHRKK